MGNAIVTVFGLVVATIAFLTVAGLNAMIRNEYSEWARPLAVFLVNLAERLNPGYRGAWMADLIYMQQVEHRDGLIYAIGSLLGTPQLWAIAAHNAAFGVHPGRSAPRVQLAAKRTVDATVGVFVLVTVFPLLVAIAVTLAVTSRRSAFVGHERFGKDGRKFTLWKFRVLNAATHTGSVMIDADLGPPCGPAPEPAFTRIGRLLRKSSLDELPQFANVVMGEMSLVGPRPPREAEVASRDASSRKRLTVKPGLTGPWQVSELDPDGPGGRVDLECDYVERWSFWRDLRILIQTPAAMFGSDAQRLRRVGTRLPRDRNG